MAAAATSDISAAELEKQRVRRNRQTDEYYRYGSSTPAGVWDDDLDKWQQSRYVCDGQGEYVGYKIHLRRSRWLSWNVYVEVPAGHIARSVTHFEFFNQLRDGMPKAPFELTYGGRNEVGVFGFDHCWQGRDLMPRFSLRHPLAVFTTCEKAKEEGVQLMKYFHDIARDNLSSILRCPRNYCDNCGEFHHEATKLVEGKNSCWECEPEVRKEARDARIAAADADNFAKKRAEHTVAVASAGALTAKGDAANAGALYAAMMAKKRKGKGKGKR